MTTAPKRANSPRLTIHQKSEIMKHFKEHALNGREIYEVLSAKGDKISYQQVTGYLAKIRTKKGQHKEEKKLHKELDGQKNRDMSAWNRKPIPTEMIEQIKALAAKGQRPTDIAHAVGCSINTAARYADPNYRTGSKRRGRPAKYSTKQPKKQEAPANLDNMIPSNREVAQPYVNSALERELLKAELKAELLREMLGK